MKKLINLIIKNIKTKIEIRKILKGHIQLLDDTLKTFADLLVEYKEILEEVKKVNFKDIYFEEHNKYNELLKENKTIKKELKKLEGLKNEQGH